MILDWASPFNQRYKSISFPVMESLFKITIKGLFGLKSVKGATIQLSRGRGEDLFHLLSAITLPYCFHTMPYPNIYSTSLDFFLSTNLDPKLLTWRLIRRAMRGFT